MNQPIPNASDYYTEAKGIAALLAKEGLAVQGQEVLAAMKHFSGTEIFMHLRFVLEPLCKNAVLSETTKKRISLLHSKLDKALSK